MQINAKTAYAKQKPWFDKAKDRGGFYVTYQFLKYEALEGVLTVTLSRPEKLNAMSLAMCREILDALDQAEMDDSVRVIIFTGEGRGFCSGTDLTADNSFDYTDVNPMEHRDEGGLIALRIYKMKKPTIAAINGAAMGVGITMTLPMDIRIASDQAKMGFVFARRGIVNEAASSFFLPKLVGIAKSLEWALSGRMVLPEEALACGLVNKVCPAETLLEEANRMAQEIANNTSAVSVALVRQLFWKNLSAVHPMEAHEQESLILQWIGSQEDAQEGLLAFQEKRTPQFAMTVSQDLPEFYSSLWKHRNFRNANCNG